MKTKKLQWIKESSDKFRSSCGKYFVWVQSRPVGPNLRRERWWAAQYMNEMPWLIDNSSLVAAKLVCEEHAAKRVDK